MSSFVSRIIIPFAAAAVACAVSLVARAEHGDVTLYEDHGRIAVGLIEESTSAITPGVRVFESLLVPDTLPFSPFDYSRGEPGFDVVDGALPANQDIDLEVVSLSVWNGAGFTPASGVDFAFFPATLSLDSDGGLHEHPLFGLVDLTLDALPLPDGVYLAQFRATTAGLAASPNIALVMLQDEKIADEDAAEELEGLLAAFDAGGPDPVFAGKNFAFFEQAVQAAAALVPEPSTASCAASAAFASILRRRRG